MILRMFLTILQTFITAPLDRITALNTFCLLVSIGLLILTFFVMPRTNSDWENSIIHYTCISETKCITIDILILMYIPRRMFQSDHNFC